MNKSHTELAEHLSRLKANIRKELWYWMNHSFDKIDAIVNNITIEILLDIGEEFELKERGQWQPIETAPKDGSEILGFEQSIGIRVISWEKEYGFWKTIFFAFRKNPPTHWMPLPKPPTE